MWGFAKIDAVLRHLPPRQPRRRADAMADEDETLTIEQQYANP
jgi:hypothetical protein